MRHRPYSWRRRVRRISPAFAGAGLFSPRLKPEGMEHRAAHQSSVLPHSLLESAGASRRSMTAFSFRRRAALFGTGSSCLGSRAWPLAGAKGTTSPGQALTASRQPVPGRHPLWCRAEPRRRPSAWGAFPHARRRRTCSTSRTPLEAPLIEQAIGLYA